MMMMMTEIIIHKLGVKVILQWRDVKQLHCIIFLLAVTIQTKNKTVQIGKSFKYHSLELKRYFKNKNP